MNKIISNLSSVGDKSCKMTIASLDFQERVMIEEKNIFNGFGCDGENLIPQFSIDNVPSDAKSLAITIYDPDAPTGSGWWHWIVYDISPSLKNVCDDSVKKSATEVFGKNVKFGKNDFGTFEYGGPCPPAGHGEHRYILTVYALKVEKLDVPENATAALIGFNICANVIEKASITAIYKR